MATILSFPRNDLKCLEGEEVYQPLGDGWVLVRLTSADALKRESVRLKIGELASEDHLTKLADPKYLFLSLRKAPDLGATILVIDSRENWIETVSHGEQADRTHALKLLAPVVSEKSWFKHYHWNHGYLFTTDGKVVSFNAPPDTLIVNGNIEIYNQTGISLPQTMVVAGDLILHTATFRRMPTYLTCLNVNVVGCTMTGIAARLKTQRDVKITMSRMNWIADHAVIGGNLEIDDLAEPVTMPNTLRVADTLKAPENAIMGFGDDTVIVGGLDLATNNLVYRYALDFAGRIIRNGDTVSVINAPDADKAGKQIKVPNLKNVEAVFYGRSAKDGSHTCQILDRENRSVHPISPLRHEIMAQWTISPPRRDFTPNLG